MALHFILLGCSNEGNNNLGNTINIPVVSLEITQQLENGTLWSVVASGNVNTDYIIALHITPDTAKPQQRTDDGRISERFITIPEGKKHRLSGIHTQRRQQFGFYHMMKWYVRQRND